MSDNFSLQKEGMETYTSISNSFIENFMPTAAGEFVKIYIYLLKCLNDNRCELSISRIADVFNNTEKDTIRALKYWQKKGLLKLTFEDNVLTSLVLTNSYDGAGAAEDSDLESDAVKVTAGRSVAKTQGETGHQAEVKGQSETNASALDAADIPAPAREAKTYSMSEIAEFSKTGDIPQLIYVVQRYLGRLLTSTDLNKILFFYDELHFSADLIEYLFEYCISAGHKSMRYIEKTAMGWADQGVHDVRSAKMLTSVYNDNCYPVMKAFGLTGRNITEGERAFVKRWTLSYGFNTDIILEACNRTIKRIHEPSFEYADSILKGWKKSGASSLNDIKKLDENFEASRQINKQKTTVVVKNTKNVKKGSFNDFSQRDIDMDALEEKLLASGRRNN